MKKGVILIVLSLLLVVGIGTAVVSKSMNNKKTIYENIFIKDINVGGLSKQEAIDSVNSTYKIDYIKLMFKDKNWKIDLKKVDFRFKTEEAVNEAYEIGRKGNFFENIKEIIDLKSNHKITINLKKEYDEKKLNDFIVNIEKEINKEPKNATLQIANQKIYVNKDEIGHEVDVKKLEKMIKSCIDSEDFNDLEIPVKEIKADIRHEDLVKVNSLLGDYSTVFKSAPGRSENVRLAATKINGIVLKPGDEFSFNEATGKRDLQSGFQMAPVIVQGELQEGIGGGVCQVSSTLFNAVLYSGLDITSRKNHSIPSSYVDKGRDATVAYGSIDFRFKNNYPEPVYIQNFVSGNTMVSRIYGNNANKKEVRIVTQITETIPRETEYKEDASLMNGKKQISEKGRDGYKVATYRNYLQNGVIVKQELISKSYYPPKKAVIVKGTKFSGVKGIDTNTGTDTNVNTSTEGTN